jgi:hypothetical protein
VFNGMHRRSNALRYKRLQHDGPLERPITAPKGINLSGKRTEHKQMLLIVCILGVKFVTNLILFFIFLRRLTYKFEKGCFYE